MVSLRNLSVTSFPFRPSNAEVRHAANRTGAPPQAHIVVHQNVCAMIGAYQRDEHNRASERLCQWTG
jgi:hypothetical protein